MGNEIREKLDAKPLFVSAFILIPASQHQLPTAATEVQFCVHELKIILFQNSVFSVEVRVGSGAVTVSKWIGMASEADILNMSSNMVTKVGLACSGLCLIIELVYYSSDSTLFSFIFRTVTVLVSWRLERLVRRCHCGQEEE